MSETIPGAPAPAAPEPAGEVAPLPPFTAEDERLWSAATHASGLVAPILGPIVVQALAKNRSTLVDENAREALNFQVSWFVVLLIGVVLTFVGVGVCIVVPVAFGGMINTILAAVEAYNGKAYKYPFTLRLVK